MVDRERMLMAGWFSIFSSLASLPMLMLSMAASFYDETYPGLRDIDHAVDIIYSFIFIYMMNSFKMLLNGHANYHAIDKVLEIIIGMTYFIIGLLVANLIFSSAKQATTFIEIIYIVVTGGLYIYMGRLILRCSHDLFGYRKTFGWLTIAEGSCYVTIIFAPLAALVSVFSAFFMAKVFFAAAKNSTTEKLNTAGD
jgi:hypothetical protein